mmetsp:Transcript_41835/g.82778  ORF Transcript_41835/g.82778 Transcript_41835/m.82778 type:complete len:99 (-) Transcript_41835:136-432(-)
MLIMGRRHTTTLLLQPCMSALSFPLMPSPWMHHPPRNAGVLQTSSLVLFLKRLGPPPLDLWVNRDVDVWLGTAVCWEHPIHLVAHVLDGGHQIANTKQ